MEIIQLSYHRNGVCGDGFYTGIIKTEDDERKVFTHFPDHNEQGEIINGDNVRTAILDLDILKEKEETRFMENSWRGDHYHDFIVDAIRENDKRILESWEQRHVSSV
tara:strand:+ start:372 stop:692 length:321 start_codon:yes stop_codon:yes gene_type:complete